MIIFEITNKTVKAIFARSVLNDIQVSAVVCKPLESDTQEELTKVISSIIDEKTFKRHKPLILCVPRNQVILRNLKFPAKDKKELDKIVSLNLTQEVPYAREEIIYNYAALDKESSGFTNVLLSIIHRRLLVKQFTVFERLNIYPDNILLSTLGLLNFFIKSHPEKDGGTQLKAGIDIGDEFTDFFIFKKNQIFFSKSIAISNTELRDEEKKEKLLSELKQSLVVFNPARHGDISRVYVSGVGGRAEEFAPKINNAFQIQTEAVDPLSVMNSLKLVKNLPEVLGKTSISSLLGIATDPLSPKFSFDLPEARLRKNARDMTKNLLVTGGIAVYLIVLALLGFTGKMYAEQGYLNKLKTEIAMLGRVNKKANVTLDKLKTIKNFAKYRDSFLFYYYEISKVVPDNINMDRLLFRSRKEITMVGKGTDMGEIFRFVRKLNNAKTFGKVKLRYSRKVAKAGEDYNEFNILCKL